MAIGTTGHVYPKFIENLLRGNISDLGDAGTGIGCILLTEYVYSSAHESYDDIDGFEISGTGYDKYGKELTGKSVEVGATEVTLEATGTAKWESSTLSATHAAVYDFTPEGDTNKKLLCYLVFDATAVSEAGDFEVRWADNEILIVEWD